MRKFLNLLAIITIALFINGCSKENETKIIDETQIPQGSPNVNNDMLNNNNTSDISYNNNIDIIDDYNTSLTNLDIKLRNVIENAKSNRVDTSDENYLAKEKEYYTNVANAYKDALDNINSLKYTNDKKAYHEAITNYYQKGYDRFNELALKYKSFNSIDDELIYKNKVGEEYFKLDNDIIKQYEEALQKIKSNFNNEINN